jgi:hypothetical protein
VEVRVDGQSVPSVDASGQTRWSFDSIANAINFEPAHTPSGGQTIEVTYWAHCQP